MKSSGFKKDLLVAMFCASLITVSQEDFNDDEVINVDVDSELNAIINQIAKDIQKTLNTAPFEVQRWIRRKTETVVPLVLSSIDTKVISLETLALYVLFVNFIERKYPLDEDLKFLVSRYDYMDLAEKLNETALGQVEEEMFKLSYLILSNLR